MVGSDHRTACFSVSVSFFSRAACHRLAMSPHLAYWAFGRSEDPACQATNASRESQERARDGLSTSETDPLIRHFAPRAKLSVKCLPLPRRVVVRDGWPDCEGRRTTACRPVAQWDSCPVALR